MEHKLILNDIYLVAVRDPKKYDIKELTTDKAAAYEEWNYQSKRFKAKVKDHNKAVLLVRLVNISVDDLKVIEDVLRGYIDPKQHDGIIQTAVSNGDCLEYYELDDDSVQAETNSNPTNSTTDSDD
jgi:hypothetical protein